jgi:hypothetical protein
MGRKRLGRALSFHCGRRLLILLVESFGFFTEETIGRYHERGKVLTLLEARLEVFLLILASWAAEALWGALERFGLASTSVTRTSSSAGPEPSNQYKSPRSSLRVLNSFSTISDARGPPSIMQTAVPYRVPVTRNSPSLKQPIQPLAASSSL